MDSVGDMLQRARQGQGLDLAAVSAQTKINPKYLQAIEADDRDSLPSGFFYRSFVHQYAGVLGLDVREIDAEIDRVLGPEAPLPLPGQESPVTKNLAPVMTGNRFDRPRAFASFGALLAVLAGCSGIYAWWHKAETHAASAVSAAAKPATVPVTTAAAPPSAHGLPAIPGYKVLVDLIAREETWLSVSSDGKRVFSGTLQPNESKTVEGREFAKLTVGNAAGLEVRLNGKLISPLGARGQVLVVVFTSDNFQIVPQVVPQPPKESD